ncbi:hypothetical protein GQR36_24645 [Enterococcus termitis]
MYTYENYVSKMNQLTMNAYLSREFPRLILWLVVTVIVIFMVLFFLKLFIGKKITRVSLMEICANTTKCSTAIGLFLLVYP